MKYYVESLITESDLDLFLPEKAKNCIPNQNYYKKYMQ